MNTIFFISRALKKSNKNAKSGKKNASSSFIAGFTVALSSLIMICAIAVSDGFKKEIREKATGFSGAIIVNTPGFDISAAQYPIDLSAQPFEKIAKIKGVDRLLPFCYKPGIIKGGGNIEGVVLKGVSYDNDLSFFKKSLIGGKMPLITDSLISNEILISRRLGDILGYGTGDTLLIYFVDESVKVRRFTVSGIYDAQLEEIDKTTVVCDLKMIQNLNRWAPEIVSGVEVLPKGNVDVDALADSVNMVIDNSSGDEVVLAVTRVTDVYPNLFDWLRLLDFNVLVVLVLMTAVAGFTMLSGVLIIIFEKISVIGTFKALGMKNSTIHKVFLSAASLIVLKGLVIGNITAVVILWIQGHFKLLTLNPANYFVKFIPVDLNIFKILMLDAGAFLLIMLFLYIPVWFISSINPADTIKVK